MRNAIFLSFTTLLLTFTTGCEALLEPTTQSHLALGNPSNAGQDPNNYLMEKSQYALSYNRGRGTPNWVAWQLNSKWLGNAERQDDFRSDESLPADWYQVTPTDYTRSGYDRGHMTPSADRTANVQDNSATFLMTNIVPQTPNNNRGAWKDLEEYCRDLVDEGKELYIVAGVYGKRDQIGKNKQVIPPTYTWKVIVVLDKPGQGVRGVSTDTRVIAVDVPNRKNTSSSWEKYRVSVDQLETKTGYDFLSQVPKSIQKEIESRVDN
ncbi:MAG: DNA/RNA non-specific endonuclease [Symploca sp. SIO2E6]|nr:DNA/RNA non-specific endonuclease [Symploca sp. SIO2E6]